MALAFEWIEDGGRVRPAIGEEVLLMVGARNLALPAESRHANLFGSYHENFMIWNPHVMGSNAGVAQCYY